MATNYDKLTVGLWCYQGGHWGVSIRHEQGADAWKEGLRAQVDDAYDFAGQGPVTDQVVEEITTLLTELVSYSAERVMGLQLALF